MKLIKSLLLLLFFIIIPFTKGSFSSIYAFGKIEALLEGTEITAETQINIKEGLDRLIEIYSESEILNGFIDDLLSISGPIELKTQFMIDEEKFTARLEVDKKLAKLIKKYFTPYDEQTPDKEIQIGEESGRLPDTYTESKIEHLVKEWIVETLLEFIEREEEIQKQVEKSPLLRELVDNILGPIPTTILDLAEKQGIATENKLTFFYALCLREFGGVKGSPTKEEIKAYLKKEIRNSELEIDFPLWEDVSEDKVVAITISYTPRSKKSDVKKSVTEFVTGLSRFKESKVTISTDVKPVSGENGVSLSLEIEGIIETEGIQKALEGAPLEIDQLMIMVAKGILNENSKILEIVKEVPLLEKMRTEFFGTAPSLENSNKYSFKSGDGLNLEELPSSYKFFELIYLLETGEKPNLDDAGKVKAHLVTFLDRITFEEYDANKIGIKYTIKSGDPGIGDPGVRDLESDYLESDDHEGDDPEVEIEGDDHEGGDHEGGDHEGGDHEGGDHEGGDHEGGDHEGGDHEDIEEIEEIEEIEDIEELNAIQ